MTSANPSQRTPIVAGNWKMHYGPTEAQDFARSILDGLNAIHAVERVLCPPAISIPAVHNIVAGFQHMRALWADPAQRRALSAEAAAAQCLFAPDQVVRQPVVAGGSAAGDFEATTLVLLQLQAAHTADPDAEMAFMTQSWSRCPAHAWVPALLAAVWGAAQERSDGV